MSDVNVLRCGQCNKPFDKETTLKRHGYYCRSRKDGKDSFRVRSCISCAKRKARCDNKRPGCSRCIDKSIECHYPTMIRKAPKIANRQIDLSSHQQSTSHLLVPQDLIIDSRLTDNNPTQVAFDDAFLSEQDFINLEIGNQNWDLPEVSFEDFLNARPFDDTVQYPFSASPAPTRLTIFETPQNVTTIHIPIPTSPSSTVRALILRPRLQTGSQRTANLIFYNLKSYPLMMLRTGTLPPFIHPKLISSNTNSTRMEPLTNCITLMHMIGSQVQGSRKLFWKNVQLECERLCAEILQLDHFELLAGMQALCLYILIRLDEGETEHNNLDTLMVKTVIMIATRLSINNPGETGQSNSEAQDPSSSWKQWLYEESRRRLAVVYRVLNMLIFFEPSGMCELQADLIMAPLPAKKQLWEASNEVTWRSESEGTQVEFGLAADGNLVKLEDGQKYCGDRLLLYEALGSCRRMAKGTENWEEWCLGMDGFGGLVMLAASLFGK